MRAIAITFTLICCLLMFHVKREEKLVLLIIGMMTLVEVQVPFVPFHKANMLLPVCFLLSEWHALKTHYHAVLRTPYLRRPLKIVIFSTLIGAITTPYFNFGGVVQAELIFKYFVIAYAFCATKNEDSLKSVLRASFYCLLVLTFFGVLNYLTMHAEFVNAVTVGRTSSIYEGVSLGDVGMESDRFRVKSMFRSPFDYGFVCAAILLLHIHGFFKGYESKRTFQIAVGCCLFGVILCGCRTVWIASLISVSIYFLWGFPLSRTSVAGLLILYCSLISYYSVPEVSEKIDSVTDIFSDNPTVSGSSLELRMIQFTTVMIHVHPHEIFGQGKGYYGKYLFDSGEADRDLYGIESVIFSYILERGFFGLILWFSFYVLIFIYFKKHRQRYRRLTGLGVSILMLYVLYSIGTGELGSVYPTMLLLGFVIKAIKASPQPLP